MQLGAGGGDTCVHTGAHTHTHTQHAHAPKAGRKSGFGFSCSKGKEESVKAPTI